MKTRHTICLFSVLFCLTLLVSAAMVQATEMPGSPEIPEPSEEPAQPEMPGPPEISEPPEMPAPSEVFVPPEMPAQSYQKVEVQEGNEKIKSLELRGVDILDVLKIIAKQGSFNLVTSKNVRGPVTVYLKDIGAWDAFQLIIKANQLAYVREGDNILVMDEREYQGIYGRAFNDSTNIEVIRLQYAKAIDIQRAMAQMMATMRQGAPSASAGRGIAIDERANAIILIDTRENISEVKKIINDLDIPTSTYIQALQYADCRQIQMKVKPMLTKQGSAEIDLATNKLIVTDIPENIIQVKEMVREFDKEPTTVTRVFNIEYGSFDQMALNIAQELTPNIGRMKADKRTNKIIVVDLPGNVERIGEILKELDEKTRQVLIEAKIIQVILNDKNEMGINWEKAFYNLEKYHNLNIKGKFELAAKGALSPGVELTIGELGDTQDDYTAFLQMLQTIGKTRTLSNPRITAINNEEASIHVGTKEAYVTQTVSQGQTTQTTAENVTFVEVGVTLKVTPTINRENMITMKIRPEVSSVSSTLPTAQGNIIPILSTSETETNIMVKDGVTIIIGGLIKDEKIKSVSQVPILGQIPLLGLLFQKKTDELKKTELVILLTPRIVSGEAGLEDIYKPFLDKKILGEKP